jgi:hypothetical protein
VDGRHIERGERLVARNSPMPLRRRSGTHCRPPIDILTKLRAVVRDRPTGLEGELDYEIRKREYEPKHRTGFNSIRERDGPGSIPRDGRNRLGRPRKAPCVRKCPLSQAYIGRSRTPLFSA